MVLVAFANYRGDKKKEKFQKIDLCGKWLLTVDYRISLLSTCRFII